MRARTNYPPIDQIDQTAALIDEPPPFRPARVTVKQVNSKQLPDISQLVFDTIFDTYDAEASLERHEQRARRFDAALAKRGCPPTEHIFQEGLERRFAGDASLERGRYWSLCHSQAGDDAGNLVFELMTYAPLMRSALVGLIDTTVPVFEAYCKNVENFPTDQPWLFVELLPFRDEPNPVVKKLFTGIDQPTTVLFGVPLSIKNLDFERAIDLRYPEVAAWFTRALTRLKWASRVPTRALPDACPTLDRFEDLLPVLLSQREGGGDGLSQVAGLMLRRLGAEALIYPSARSSARVEVRDGELCSWHCWNLVDYRGAQLSYVSTAHTDLVQWPSAIVPEAAEAFAPRIEVDRRDDFAGSWKVAGLRSWNHFERLRNETKMLIDRHQEESLGKTAAMTVVGFCDYAMLDRSISQLAQHSPYNLFYVHTVLRRALVNLGP